MIKEILNKFKNYDYIFLIQVTTPYLKSVDLINAFNKFKRYNYDSMFSSYASKKFFGKK